MSKKRKAKCPFRFLQEVQVGELPKGCEKDYPFKRGDRVYFLGEVPGATGHCAVAVQAGKRKDMLQISLLYHTDTFEAVRE